MNRFWRGGELFVWLTASGVAVSLLMVGGMLALIMVHGLGQFWPAPLQEVTLKNRQILIGEAIGHTGLTRLCCRCSTRQSRNQRPRLSILGRRVSSGILLRSCVNFEGDRSDPV